MDARNLVIGLLLLVLMGGILGGFLWITSQSDEFSRIERQLRRQTQEVERLRGEVEGLESQLRTARSQSQRVPALERQIRTKDGVLEERNQQIATLEQRLTDLEQRLADQTQQLATASPLASDPPQDSSASSAEESSIRGQLQEREREMASLQQAHQAAVAEKDRLAQQLQQIRRDIQQSQTEQTRSTQIQQELIESLKQEIEEGKIQVAQMADRTAIRLENRILFDSGQATVKPSGRQILQKIGNALKQFEDKHVQVEGHTDDRPIGPKLKHKFDSNWELSVARATNVVRYLADRVKFNSRQISAAGYGSTQPLVSNETKALRQKNRRVEFVLLPLRVSQ